MKNYLTKYFGVVISAILPEDLVVCVQNYIFDDPDYK
jgi:hypothetical protein